MQAIHSPVMEAVFKLNGNTAETRQWAAGPWSASQQHGSAPSSLIAYIVEQMPALQPMRVARMTIDLMRPVPVAPLEIKTQVLREGRKIQLIGVQLVADGVEVVRANVLRIRAQDMELPSEAASKPVALPLPQSGGVPTVTHSHNPFLSGLSMQEAKGGFMRRGPAAVWFRANRPIIEGVETTPLMRAAVTADFCNGVSSVLDFTKYTFINADLTISLSRMPVGEWILLDAESWIGKNGAGIAFGGLADVHGYFGRSIQSLVIEPR
jgi:hypothetical protein